jgi:tetratricopeptide (TPR) repeat protein
VSSVLRTLTGLNLGGVYLNAGGGPIDSSQVYREMLSASSPPAGEPARKETEVYPLLLGLAITLLMAESLISDRNLQMAAVVLLLLVALPGESFQHDDTSSPSGMVNAGNRLFKAGDYSDALHYYLMASEAAPNSPQVLFNLAVSLYRTKDYPEAASTYQRAAAQSRDPKFRAQCKFGEANAAYRIAMKQSGKLFDFEQALSLTIPMYRDALALDPSLIDCKYNIEVVKRKLRELSGSLQAATNRFMTRSHTDLARRENTEASQILNESKNSKKTKGLVGRPKIDTDW